MGAWLKDADGVVREGGGGRESGGGEEVPRVMRGRGDDFKLVIISIFSCHEAVTLFVEDEAGNERGNDGRGGRRGGRGRGRRGERWRGENFCHNQAFCIYVSGETTGKTRIHHHLKIIIIILFIILL